MKKLLFRHPHGTTDNRMWEVHVVDANTNEDDYIHCVTCTESYVRYVIGNNPEWYRLPGNERLDGVHEFLMETYLQQHKKGEVCYV